MFREMRRKDRQLDDKKLEEILYEGQYGILATVNESGYPCTVPLSYAYADGNIYFHGAVSGQKIDNINNDDRVSFCVVGKTKLLPEKFSTAYESAVVFGRAAVIDGDEKIYALEKLIKKYSSEYHTEGMEYIKNAAANTCVVKITVEHMTAKGRNDQ